MLSSTFRCICSNSIRSIRSGSSSSLVQCSRVARLCFHGGGGRLSSSGSISGSGSGSNISSSSSSSVVSVDTRFVRALLARLAQRYADVEQSLATGAVPPADMRRHMSTLKRLAPASSAYRRITAKAAELHDVDAMIKDERDSEILEMLVEESENLKKSLRSMEEAAVDFLVEVDEDDDRDVILEVRAGTGGEEAALFSQDMFNMYHKFSSSMGWRFEPLDIREAEKGGFKEATATIRGTDVFAKLKFEAGVHRVQRIPSTESNGRVHTSAMSVGVMPEASSVDVQINMKDVRFDVYRSRGAGGQSVNTTESAVRVVHQPTGLTVCMQDERSQHKNRAKALKVLETRLYALEREKRHQKQRENRNSQMGSGDRSERIRTYNFPQNRVTDHRINETKFGIDRMMDGSLLCEFIDKLAERSRHNQLLQLVEMHQTKHLGQPQE